MFNVDYENDDDWNRFLEWVSEHSQYFVPHKAKTIGEKRLEQQEQERIRPQRLNNSTPLVNQFGLPIASGD